MKTQKRYTEIRNHREKAGREMDGKTVAGHWKPELLMLLAEGSRRWGELLEALPEAGPGSLGRVLKELMAAGLILRLNSGTRYQKVRYRLTERGAEAAALHRGLMQWSGDYGLSEQTARKLLACPAQRQLLALIRGPIRPGTLERQCPQLSRSVMERQLGAMTRLGLLQRISYPTVPPRVEYQRTPAAEALAALLSEW